MPELPEVETVRRTLALAISGEVIESVDLLYPKIIQTDMKTFSQAINHQTIHDLDRKGKHLIFILDDYAMIIHLRMEGKFFIKTKSDPIDKHEHIIFRFRSGKELRYHDVRKFGTIHLVDIHDYLSSTPLKDVAAEPKDLDFETFYARIHSRKTEIKAVLLDQHVVSGLGNIYVDETLFLAKIHPMRSASSMSKKEALSILEAAKYVLEKAVALGGTTIRSYTSSLGVHGRFQNELNVHMQKDKPCPICGTPIIKMKVKGRGTYVCETCQPKPKTHRSDRGHRVR